MAEFENEPGDYIPPPPWEAEPELPPAIAQGENLPVTGPSDYELPPLNQGGGQQRGSGYGGGGGEEPPPERPSPYGPLYPGERPYPEHGPVMPALRYNPNNWWESERGLQEKWGPAYNPGPLPSPYSWWPQQPGIPESMFQQGKGWTPTPQFQETVNLTPEGYSETITSPSNWMIPTPPRAVGPQMPQPPPRYGGGGGGYGGGGYGGYGNLSPEFIRWLMNLLNYGGLQRI